MALDNGWFKVDRQMVKSDIWQKSTPNQSKVLITLMGMVNFSEKVCEFDGRSIVLQSGQVITSLDEITRKCGKGISTNNVRSALKRFEKLGFITVESTKRGRLITVSDYETYVADILHSNKRNSKRSTTEVQASHKSDTTNKNFKNNRKEKGEKETPPPEFQIEQLLKDFYYKPTIDRLDSLIQEIAYTGSKEKIPLIIKKFSSHSFAKNGTVLPFPQIRAAFKVWLMNEKDFSQKSIIQEAKRTINLSKISNQRR